MRGRTCMWVPRHLSVGVPLAPRLVQLFSGAMALWHPGVNGSVRSRDTANGMRGRIAPGCVRITSQRVASLLWRHVAAVVVGGCVAVAVAVAVGVGVAAVGVGCAPSVVWLWPSMPSVSKPAGMARTLTSTTSTPLPRQVRLRRGGMQRTWRLHVQRMHVLDIKRAHAADSILALPTVATTLTTTTATATTTTTALPPQRGVGVATFVGMMWMFQPLSRTAV